VDKSGVKTLSAVAFKEFQRDLEARIRASCKPVLDQDQETKWASARAAEANSLCVRVLAILELETAFNMARSDKHLISKLAEQIGHRIGSLSAPAQRQSPTSPFQSYPNSPSPNLSPSPISSTLKKAATMSAASPSEYVQQPQPHRLTTNHFPINQRAEADLLPPHAQTLRDARTHAAYSGTAAATASAVASKTVSEQALLDSLATAAIDDHCL